MTLNYINHVLIEKGLSYIADSVPNRYFVLVLRNGNQDNVGSENEGKSIPVLDEDGVTVKVLTGIYGFSYAKDATSWTPIEVIDEGLDESQPSKTTLSLKPLNPDETYIEVLATDPPGANIATHFSILQIDTLVIDQVSEAKEILTYELENQLTLNNDSRFSFSNFSITNGLQ